MISPVLWAASGTFVSALDDAAALRTAAPADRTELPVSRRLYASDASSSGESAGIAGELGLTGAAGAAPVVVGSATVEVRERRRPPVRAAADGGTDAGPGRCTTGVRPRSPAERGEPADFADAPEPAWDVGLVAALSAQATAVPSSRAAPTPSATANPPTRPTTPAARTCSPSQEPIDRAKASVPIHGSLLGAACSGLGCHSYRDMAPVSGIRGFDFGERYFAVPQGWLLLAGAPAQMAGPRRSSASLMT